jgi:hypothetical protein
MALPGLQRQLGAPQLREAHRFRLFAAASGLLSARPLWTALSRLLPDALPIRPLLAPALLSAAAAGIAAECGVGAALQGAGMPSLEASAASVVEAVRRHYSRSAAGWSRLRAGADLAAALQAAAAVPEPHKAQGRRPAGPDVAVASLLGLQQHSLPASGSRNSRLRQRAGLPLLDPFYSAAMPQDGLLPSLSSLSLSVAVWGGPGTSLPIAGPTQVLGSLPPQPPRPPGSSLDPAPPRIQLTPADASRLRLAWAAGALPLPDRPQPSLSTTEATALWGTVTAFPLAAPHLGSYALLRLQGSLAAQLRATAAAYAGVGPGTGRPEAVDALAPAVWSEEPYSEQHPPLAPLVGLLQALSMRRGDGGSVSGAAGDTSFPLWTAAILRLGVHRTLLAAAQAPPLIPPFDPLGEPYSTRHIPLELQRAAPAFMPAAHRRLRAAVAELTLRLEGQARRHGVRVGAMSAAVPALLQAALGDQFGSEDATQRLGGALLQACAEDTVPQPAFAYALQAATMDAPDAGTVLAFASLARHLADDPQQAAPADLPIELRGLLQPIVKEHHLTEAVRAASERLLCITALRMRATTARRALVLRNVAGAAAGELSAAAAAALLGQSESPADKLLAGVTDGLILETATLASRAYDGVSAACGLAAAALTVAHTLPRSLTDEALGRRLAALSLPLVPGPAFGAVAQLLFALTVARAPFLADRLRGHMFEEVLAFHGRASRASMEFTASRRALAQVLGRLAWDEAVKGCTVVPPDVKHAAAARLVAAAGPADAPSVAAMAAAVTLQLGVAGVAALGPGTEALPQLLVAGRPGVGPWLPALVAQRSGSPSEAESGTLLAAALLHCAEEWGRAAPGAHGRQRALQPHMAAPTRQLAAQARALRAALEAQLHPGGCGHALAQRASGSASRDLQAWLAGSALRLAVVERRLLWPEFQLRAAASRIAHVTSLLQAPPALGSSWSELAAGAGQVDATRVQVAYALSLDTAALLRAIAREREGHPGVLGGHSSSSSGLAAEVDALLPSTAEAAAEVAAFLLEQSGSGDAEDVGACLAYHAAKGLNALRRLQPLRKRDEQWGLRVARRLRNMQLHVHPAGAAALAELQQLMGVQWHAVVSKVLP